MILGIVIGALFGVALGLLIVRIARWQEIKPQKAAVGASVLAMIAAVTYFFRLSPGSFRTTYTLEETVEFIVIASATVATVWAWWAIERRQRRAG